MMAKPEMYKNKVMLAPMVRIGTLPTRLLALDYGADLVYTEEIIDFKMLQTKRIENAVLQTTDYVASDASVAFRTCEREHSHLVFQMGTADAKRALKVAKMVENNIAAIDINMGCPKEFSIKGGMGAALLKQPEKIREILTTLVRGLSIPVTCKIRVLPTLEDTIALAQLIESTGVSALGIHGRLTEERPRHPNRNSTIKAIAQAIKIPVIANGGSKEIKTYEDIAKFKEECGAASVMLARVAQWNPSIFRRQGMLPNSEVVKAYLKYAVQYNHLTNIKYVVQQLVHEELESQQGKALQAACTIREVCSVWKMEDLYDEMQESLRQKEARLKRHLEDDDGTGVKKRKLEDGTELLEIPVRYDKREYQSKRTPKTVLYEWTVKEKIDAPKYESVENQDDHTYYSTVSVNGKKYASSNWDKSKKFGEQACAVVCLHVMGMDDGKKKVPAANQNRQSDHMTSTANQQIASASPVASETSNVNCVTEKAASCHVTKQSANQSSGLDQVTPCDEKMTDGDFVPETNLNNSAETAETPTVGASASSDVR